VQGAALLKIHHTTAKIMAGVRPDMSDMRAPLEVVNAEKSLEYLDDFQIIINLSTPLIAAAEQDAKNGKPPLTFSNTRQEDGCQACTAEYYRGTGDRRRGSDTATIEVFG
jgi:hypothetical protein